MASKDYYTIMEEAQNFICIKMDPDEHVPKTENNNQGTPNRYTIGKEGKNLAMCDCWAGAKFCRHKQMLVEFQKLNRVNSRWLFNFDKKKWLPPLQQES